MLRTDYPDPQIARRPCGVAEQVKMCKDSHAAVMIPARRIRAINRCIPNRLISAQGALFWRAWQLMPSGSLWQLAAIADNTGTPVKQG